jgi:pseudouridine synthase
MYSGHRYFIINKPYNMVSQFVSTHAVRLLGDLNFDFPEGTHAIGRLDNLSEGLLILTTNKRVTKLLFQGDIPHARTYLVQVRGEVKESTIEQLQTGIRIRVRGGAYWTTTSCEVSIVKDYNNAYEPPAVRHLREGAVENNRSKAILINAVHHLVDKWNRLYYFPAYELIIDDLRDYRFYAEDLVHPNYAATQYVWERFTEACMDEATKSLLEEIRSIQLAFQHKPFNYMSAQHQKFLHSFYTKTAILQEKHPYIDFKKELLYFGRPPDEK